MSGTGFGEMYEATVQRERENPGSTSPLRGPSGGGSSKKKTQQTPEPTPGLTPEEIQERQRIGIEASQKGQYYPQERNLFSGPEAREYKAKKDAERGIFYQQVPNLYTEADIRNYEKRVKDNQEALTKLDSYKSGEGYDIVQFLRDNPNEDGVKTLRNAGFQRDDINKAQIESIKPQSLEDFTDNYLKRNYPGKNYTESNIKSRKLLPGESDAEGQKRFSQQDKILREATDAYVQKYGKGALIGTGAARAGELLFAPARALRPEITLKDISGAEWVIGGAQVALLVVAPIAGKTISGAAGQLTSKGIQAAAGGVFAADTAKNWNNMNNTERAMSLAMDTIIIGTVLPGAGKGIVKGVKSIDKTYTRLTGQNAEAGGFRLDPTPGKNLINTIESHGDPLSIDVKNKINEQVIKVQEAGNEAIMTKKYGKFTDELENLRKLESEIKNPYAKQAFKNAIDEKLSMPKKTLDFADEVSQGKQGPPEQVIQKNNRFMDDLNDDFKRFTKSSPEKSSGPDVIKTSDMDKIEGNYKQPIQRESQNMSLEERIKEQAKSDRMAKLIEKAPRQLRERYYKALEKQGTDREDAIKEMDEYLEDKYGKKELDNYKETGDFEGKPEKPESDYTPPERGGDTGKRGGTATKEKTETLTEAEKKALNDIKKKYKNTETDTLTDAEKQALEKIKNGDKLTDAEKKSLEDIKGKLKDQERVNQERDNYQKAQKEKQVAKDAESARQAELERIAHEKQTHEEYIKNEKRKAVEYEKWKEQIRKIDAERVKLKENSNEAMKLREDLKKAIKEREELTKELTEEEKAAKLRRKLANEAHKKRREELNPDTESETKTETKQDTDTSNKTKLDQELKQKLELETKLQEKLKQEQALQNQLNQKLKEGLALKQSLKQAQALKTKLKEQMNTLTNKKLSPKTEQVNQTENQTKQEKKTEESKKTLPVIRPNNKTDNKPDNDKPKPPEGNKPPPPPPPPPPGERPPPPPPEDRPIPPPPPPPPEKPIIIPKPTKTTPKKAKELVKKKVPGTIAFEQGALKAGEVVKVVPPPYDKKYTLVGKYPAGYKDTGDTPKDTIQTIGGPTKENVDIPIGVTTAHARANEKEITFTANKVDLVTRWRELQRQRSELRHAGIVKTPSGRVKAGPSTKIGKPRSIRGVGLTRRVRTGKIQR